MKLPSKNDIIIIHYGCSSFEKKDDKVYWLGAVYYLNDQKKYFFTNGDEIKSIESFSNFLEKNADRTILHWSMNSPKFGFIPIEKRYLKLKGSSIKIHSSKQIDLSEYFKDKYGLNYVSREGGRLNNLAIHNGFTGFKKNIEVKNNSEASDRLELLFSIYQAEIQDKLKISRTSLFDVKMWNKPCFELFEYLMSNYYTNKKVQATSIWFFLKEISSDPYIISCTKEVYKNYINIHYNLRIKNFDKPQNWNDVKRIPSDLRINFQDT